MAGQWIDTAKRHPRKLHKALVGDHLGEVQEHLHHDGGDHGSGQSLPHKHKQQEARGQRRAANPRGNPGYHPSTDGYEHDGYMHTSEHR